MDSRETPRSALSALVPSSPIFGLQPRTPLFAEQVSTPKIFGLMPRTPLLAEHVSISKLFGIQPRTPLLANLVSTPSHQRQPLTPNIATCDVIAASSLPQTSARLGLPRAKERIAVPISFTFSALPTLPRVVELEGEEPSPALIRRSSLTTPAMKTTGTLAQHMNMSVTPLRRLSDTGNNPTPAWDSTPPERLIVRKFRAVTTTTSPMVCFNAATLATSHVSVQPGVFLQTQSADIHSDIKIYSKSASQPSARNPESVLEVVNVVATPPRVALSGMETQPTSMSTDAAAACLASSRPSPRLTPARSFLKPVKPYSILLETASVIGTPVLQCDPSVIGTPVPQCDPERCGSGHTFTFAVIVY